jgi:hypothetical protein
VFRPWSWGDGLEENPTKKRREVEVLCWLKAGFEVGCTMRNRTAAKWKVSELQHHPPLVAPATAAIVP